MLTTDLSSPQMPGTTVTWTATPVGGVAPHQYKWWVFDGAVWSLLADWSTNNTLAWAPTVANANYRVGVWVRSAGNLVDAAEFPQSAPFASTGPSPVSGVMLITNLSPPVWRQLWLHVNEAPRVPRA